MNQLQVFLSEEQTESLKRYIFEVTKESIAEAKRVAGLDRPILKQKYAAEFLGISVNTLKSLEAQGLPSITIDGLKMYSKEEMVKWMLSKQK